ncbi:MAG: orotidine-5'-phosphate decarboxylase [Opitutales bacterium]
MTTPVPPPAPEIILPIDVAHAEEAERLLDQIGDAVTWVKVGLQLFCREGPTVVTRIAERGYRVFLDLKLHDIPNTVAKAVESVADLPVHLLTIHASGGEAMMTAAREAQAASRPELQLLAVTVLTSTNADGLIATGVEASPENQVVRLARLAARAGITGLVCSPLEIRPIAAALSPLPLLVTPGVRPAGSGTQDQKRVLTPQEAVAAGARMLVIGRPIRAAPDPKAAAESIRRAMAEAVSPEA